VTPSVAREIVIGIDVGTTSIKAVALDLDGVVVGHASSRTMWDIGARGEVQVGMDSMADAAIDVMARAAQSVDNPVTVIGIGIAGLAETGVVMDSDGTPVTPAIAWYDQRGAEELAALPADFRTELSAVTGLAAKAECSFSKLLWLRAHGYPDLGRMRWLNALEYIAYRLTGAQATEQSLASRTALIDQNAITPWSTGLELIGATSTFLPDFVAAGTSIGVVRDAAPEILRGSVVTVAGHDHLVNSVGAGAVGGDCLFDSCGTADVILRTVPRTLTNDERSLLVTRGLSAGRHVLSGSTAILGATRSGLVLGRVLSMLGARNRADRRRLADTWQPGGDPIESVVVSEPGGWANEVTIQLLEDASPAQVWAAAMAYVLGETAQLVQTVAEVVGPYETAVAAGGWAHLEGVFRGKAHIMPGLVVSDVEQAGARGAAMFAAHAAGVTTGALVHDLPLHATTKELVT
jgi:sugar (pentulose or hexulose) kinase